jgi:hypothetical protein
MAMIYARISDPEVRRQYEQALTNGARIAGPAAEALLHGKLDTQRFTGSSRPSSNLATACACRLKAPANVTWCPPARSSLRPPSTRHGCAHGSKRKRCSFKMRDNGAGKGRLSGIKRLVDVSSNCCQRLHRTAAAVPAMMACHSLPARVKGVIECHRSRSNNPAPPFGRFPIVHDE